MRGNRAHIHDNPIGELTVPHPALDRAELRRRLAFGRIFLADVIHSYAAADANIFMIESVHEIVFRKSAEIEFPCELELDALTRVFVGDDVLQLLWRRDGKRSRRFLGGSQSRR